MVADVACVGLSAVAAVVLRDNFIIYEDHFKAVFGYAAIAVAVSIPIFMVTDLHERLWKYSSLPDVLRIAGLAAVIVLTAVAISFATSRLQGVARSVPFIQWFLLVSAMVAMRVVVRLRHDHIKKQGVVAATRSGGQHVLVVGLSHVTELYLLSVAEYAAGAIEVVGILSEERAVQGRALSFCKVLGAPHQLSQVLESLEVHGVTLDRIVVTQRLQEFSPRARDALIRVEEESEIQIDWLVERLGLTAGPAATSVPEDSGQTQRVAYAALRDRPVEAMTPKRVGDVLAVLALSLCLSPVIAIVGLLVALDVGSPLVFWQKRPGRFGRPFKLYKFRTMRGLHDKEGERIADDERTSPVGRLLQRLRLDELPQLYNILIGEMSFVGPRPLLPGDQPEQLDERLSVLPGLTGLAQVHGGRHLSPEEKNVLDIWYVRNQSWWLDIKILIRTVLTLIAGERVNDRVLRGARKVLWGTELPRRDDASILLGAESNPAERAELSRRAS